MNKYLGVKMVNVLRPMNRNEALNNGYKVGDTGSMYEPVEGYEIEYEGGYKSWSPKDVFEKAYRPVGGLTFGLAIEALKEGKYVCRKGWNGKGMYLFYIGTDMGSPGKGGWTYTNGKNDNCPLLPFIAMKTADNKVVPWLASQTDILAEDWETEE